MTQSSASFTIPSDSKYIGIACATAQGGSDFKILPTDMVRAENTNIWQQHMGSIYPTATATWGWDLRFTISPTTIAVTAFVAGSAVGAYAVSVFSYS